MCTYRKSSLKHGHRSTEQAAKLAVHVREMYVGKVPRTWGAPKAFTQGLGLGSKLYTYTTVMLALFSGHLPFHFLDRIRLNCPGGSKFTYVVKKTEWETVWEWGCCDAVFSLGLYWSALCPLGFQIPMCPLWSGLKQNVPFANPLPTLCPLPFNYITF